MAYPDDTLDQQTQDLLDLITARPVEPVRPASPTPFKQQTGGQKAETITAALADVARIVQNAKRPIGAERGVGFSANLAGERDSLAREEADRQTASLQGEDRSRRQRADYELRLHEKSVAERDRQKQTDKAKKEQEEVHLQEQLEHIRETHGGDVAYYLKDSPEMVQEFQNSRDYPRLVTITGAARMEQLARDAEEKEQRRRDGLARSGGGPKEAKPPNETDQKNYTESLSRLDAVAATLPEQLATGAIRPAQVRAEFKTRLSRLDGVMHEGLIARYQAEYERVIEPLLQEAEAADLEAAKARQQEARTSGEQGRTRARVNSSTPTYRGGRPPQN